MEERSWKKVKIVFKLLSSPWTKLYLSQTRGEFWRSFWRNVLTNLSPKHSSYIPMSSSRVERAFFSLFFLGIEDESWAIISKSLTPSGQASYKRSSIIVSIGVGCQPHHPLHEHGALWNTDSRLLGRQGLRENPDLLGQQEFITRTSHHTGQGLARYCFLMVTLF